MEYLRQTEFWLYGIVEIASPQPLSRLGILAVRVARLYHKVLDDTMEQQRVVHLHAHQLQEVVAMLRCLVVEGYADVSLRRLQPKRRRVARVTDHRGHRRHHHDY